MTRTPVILCSPYAGDRERNDAYLKAAMLDSIGRNEAPFASHAIYPHFLNDAVHDEREVGLACEHAWLALAYKVVAYVDLGISSGMARAMALADATRIEVERRAIEAESLK